MDFLSLIKERVVLFDGGMGMLLTERGLKPGAAPYTFNLTAPATVLAVHKEYVGAGADVVTANTFTATNPEAIRAGVALAKQAGARFAALDIGPVGRLMRPMGDLSVEEVYKLTKEIVRAGSQADLILIETMSDLYECKAAVLAAKENSSLPVVCTVTIQDNGRTLTGASLQNAVAVLESCGADALGVNCSLGPEQLQPYVEQLLTAASVPVVIQPNAGLPRVTHDGKTVYNVTPQVFADYMLSFANLGVSAVGGCCGTTPAHTAELHKRLGGMPLHIPSANNYPVIAASGTRTAALSEGVLVIGERLNPTGKKRLQRALREGDMELIRTEALAQQEAGCHILDVNAGLPDIDEPKLLARMVCEVQSVSNLPVQIDSADPAAIDAALRVVNGKAIVNSVSAKQASMDAVLPLVKKYGAAVIGLTLDDDGIPETAEARLEIAKKIRNAAEAYGIPDRDILIDCLTLTVAAQPRQAKETLRAIRMVKEELGLATVLGVSNISYGMPEREKLGAAFLTAALSAGLDAAILNPLSEPFAEALRNWKLLSGENPACSQEQNGDISLQRVIEQYDAGKIFLPELLQAANREIEALRKNAASTMNVAPVILASVRGDIHDIGKNIVKTMLECHGFPVVDLGKDVSTERIIAAVREHKACLVGLSALMTTTVRNMQDSINAVHGTFPDCTVMFGGAAVDKTVSDAAVYGRDALAAVAIAKKVYGLE